MRKLIIILIALAAMHIADAQTIGNFVEDEGILYAETKQMNQFFRRFNGEENYQGHRFFKSDEEYRDSEFRKKYLNGLFNNESDMIVERQKKRFIESVTSDSTPVFLDFHGGEWFAEVQTKFLYQGKEEHLILFLKLQQEEVGSKWVIKNLYFRPFAEQFFKSDSTVNQRGKFLHPLSHEIDFMNLVKVFKDDEIIEYYTTRDYKPDFLTLFIYEFRKGNMQFISVINTKFHFFQVPGWYFEVSDHQRRTYNSGWLISNILPISEEDREIIIGYIYQN